MTTALATTQAAVTPEQIELIKRTVANGATPDELKLYLFDCARQGVHPLDKLLHFTKRDGRYVPVTSIDFMRIRAAETGEYAGSDDAIFEETISGEINHATVTVWRLVQGQRCQFTATARWSEYKPDAGASGKGDRMWKRMPHTMLAKCAEGLALRKGFPRQLAGLYVKEELDQAEDHLPAVIDTTSGEELKPPAPAARFVPATISDKQAGRLWKIATDAGWKEPELKKFLKDKHGFESLRDIAVVHYDAIVKAVQEGVI